MGYSIQGLSGFSDYEFPHSKYFEGEGNLVEILRMYNLLVKDYNVLVNEIVEAHKLYIEAQNFVERQERIFLDNQTKIMLHFKEVIDEVNRLQQELVNYFNSSAAEMAAKQEELENLFRELNRQTLEQMKDYLDTAIRDFADERIHFEQTLIAEMEKFRESFSQDIDKAIEVINNNYDAFKVWIGSEFDVLADLLAQNADTIERYFQRVKENNEQLLSAYEEKLRIARDAIIREVNRQFDQHENDVEQDFIEFKEYVDDLVVDLNHKIEDAKNINEHVLVEHIHVFSPPTRKIRMLQTALNEMYIYFRAWALRAGEYDGIGITAGEYDNWVCDKGRYPQGVGIKALDYDALGKWILLEKPDILEQLKGQIEQITYDKLVENQEKIEQAIQDNLEKDWGARVVNLESSVNILENMLNESKEYTAQVEDELKAHMARASILYTALNSEVKTTSSIVSGVVNTTSIMRGELDNVILSSSIMNGKVDNVVLSTSIMRGEINNVVLSTSIMNAKVSNMVLSTSIMNNKIDNLVTTTSVMQGTIKDIVDAIIVMQDLVINALT